MLSHGASQYISRLARLQPTILSRILYFPYNVLYEILSSLDFNTLTRVLRVCRRLNSVAAPILYQIVIIKANKASSFVLSLNNNPYLRGCVHALTVHDHHTVDTLDAEILAPAIARLQNLRHLVIKGCYTDFSEVSSMSVLAHSRLFIPTLQSPFLTNLESCALSLSQSEPWDIAGRECIFTHPSLKRLAIVGATMSDYYSFTELIRNTTPLKDLSLVCCDLSPNTLRKILSVPRNLSRFSMMGPRQLGRPEYTITQHDLYIEAMHVQAHALTALRVGFWYHEYDSPPPTINLHPFIVLRDLTISPITVPTVDGEWQVLTQFSETLFPRSLRFLTIFHVNYRTFHVVEEMVKHSLSAVYRSGALPNLLGVTFATPPLLPLEPGRYDLPDGWDELFLGQVEVRRVLIQLMRNFPLACGCCEYTLGRLVVMG